MDPVANPYTPGAGTPPPELAGRDALREQLRVALARLQRGRPAKSVLLLGLRGVGKTVLLDQMRTDAESVGVQTLRIEAPEGRSLPAVLAPELRRALLRLSRSERAKELADRALRGLSGFVNALRMKYGDIEVALDVEPEPGLADNGDLESDLTALLEAAGEAAKAANTVIALFVDELQYVDETELAALITSLHRCAQRRLPVVMIGAGLPQLRAKTGRAKSYAERLFDFSEVGPLEEAAARLALVAPALAENVEFDDSAVAAILELSQGYAYFLQEWGKHTWDAADSSPITRKDVEAGTATAIAELDSGFFAVRFDRLTPAEKRYVRAMAELGAGPHRSGSIADELGLKVTSLGPTRAKLIDKGMVWSPNHGETAFTVPMFDEFMRRVMPRENWRTN